MFPLLSCARSCTYSKVNSVGVVMIVEGKAVHVTPPSVLFKIPLPFTASILNQPSPVPAYIMFALFLSWRRQVIARLEIKSFTGAHVAEALVKLVVLNKPPLTDPANTVLPVASLLSIIIARVRPPTLFGPRSCQVSAVIFVTLAWRLFI